MTLDHQLYQSWLLHLQTWAADGRLFSAAVDALRLQPGEATEHLKHIADRLAKGDTRDLPPIELLPGSAMPSAAGAYAKATKTIYINQKWIQTANEIDAIKLLTEEFGHHLDNQLKDEDSPGDEGAIFSELLLSSDHLSENPRIQTDLINENDHGLIRVNSQLLDAEFNLYEGTSGDDNYNGDSSDETIYGYGGADFLKGGGGSDYIYGGGGSDKIRGKWTGDLAEANNDFNYLFGGEGNDTVWGASKKTSCVAMEIKADKNPQTTKEMTTSRGMAEMIY